MAFVRSGSATWQGGLKDGTGTVTTGSGAINALPYSFKTRFDDQQGTNPEELVGAAHAGCFTMALSKILGEAGLTADMMETKADVKLEQVDGGFAVTSVHLTLEGKVPGADQAKFEELANVAKENCPISKLLDTNITLDTKLVG